MVSKSVVVLLVCVSVVAGVSKRSSRWDQHLNHLHSKRQTQCNWQSKQANPQCTLQDLTTNDALGRRGSGILAPVESQGTCGSCWAFAGTHTYTDARSISSGSLTPLLSSQYPASCFKDQTYVGGGGNGCCGGTADACFKFFMREGAVTDTCAPYDPFLSSYIYDKREGAVNPSIAHTCPTTCADGTQFNPADLRASGAQWLDKTQVIAALANGPVAVSITTSDLFRTYRCGVFCESKNYIRRNGHAMEIVDYGTEAGVDFWVIKNSHGTNFGEDGYIRIRRGDLLMRKYIIPVLTPGQDTSDDTSSELDCSPTDVTDPVSDELVMSAVEHTVDEINDNNAVPCPDGSQASSVALNTITGATTQEVDGVIIITELKLDIMGCEDSASADVDSTVVLQDDDTFDLIDYTYDYDNGGSAVTGCVAMVMVAMAIVLLLM